MKYIKTSRETRTNAWSNNEIGLNADLFPQYEKTSSNWDKNK